MSVVSQFQVFTLWFIGSAFFGGISYTIYWTLVSTTNIKTSLNWQLKKINEVFGLNNQEFKFNLMSPKIRAINSKIILFVSILPTIMISFLFGIQFVLAYLGVGLGELELWSILAPAIYASAMLGLNLLLIVLSFILTSKKHKNDFTNEEVLVRFNEYRNNWVQKYGNNVIRFQTFSNGQIISTILNKKNRYEKNRGWGYALKRMPFYKTEFAAMNEIRSNLYFAIKQLKKLEKELQTRQINFVLVDEKREIPFADIKDILLHNAMVKFLPVLTNDSYQALSN